MERRVAEAAATTVAARAAKLSALLDFARAFCSNCSMPEAVIHRLIVILEELFLNTVHNGHGGGSDAPVTVELSVVEGALQCSYTDSAPLFVPPSGLPDHIACPPEARPVGGLGVAMVRSLASGLSHAPATVGSGNRIVFVVDLGMGTA
jgi:anti-sigma regulatory factor (Ser/Thr protein kinase)